MVNDFILFIDNSNSFYWKPYERSSRYFELFLVLILPFPVSRNYFLTHIPKEYKLCQDIFCIRSGRNISIPGIWNHHFQVPVWILAPGTAHVWPSAWPPIDISRKVSAHFQICSILGNLRYWQFTLTYRKICHSILNYKKNVVNQVWIPTVLFINSLQNC